MIVDAMLGRRRRLAAAGLMLAGYREPRRCQRQLWAGVVASISATSEGWIAYAA